MFQQDKLTELTNAITQLTAAFRQGGQKDWRSYTGILPQQGSAQSVLYNRTRDAAAGMLSGFVPGPLGQMLGQFGGRLAADALVGQPYNKFGMATNLMGTIPIAVGGAGTASAYQQMMLNSADVYRNTMGRQQQTQLRKQFIRNYYSLTTGKTGDALQAQVNGAMDNPVNLPNAIRLFTDPTNIANQVSNAAEVGRYTANQIMRRNAFDVGLADKSNRAQQAVYQMALDSARPGADYGGFGASAVTDIAKVLAQSSQIMGGANTQQQITKAVTDFKTKVQNLSKALAPLKDIFGQDVQAMAGALQSITGQRFGAMSPQRISQLSSQITAAVRFAGVSPAQIAAYSNVAQQLGQKYGADDATLAGLRSMGARLAATASGNAPMATTQASYTAHVSQMFAKAGASRGADLMAKMFALAKEKDSTLTMQSFMQKVNASSDPMKEAMRLANISNINQAQGGADSVWYLKAKQQGLGTNIALTQGFRSNTSRATQWSASQVEGASARDAEAVQQFIQKADADTLSTIAEYGVDPQHKFVGYDKLSPTQRRVLQRMMTYQGGAYRKSLAGIANNTKAAQAAKAQRDLQQLFKNVDKSGTPQGLVGAILTGSLFQDGDQLTDPQRAQLMASLNASVGTILGTGSDPEKVKAAVTNLNEVFGRTEMVTEYDQYGTPHYKEKQNNELTQRILRYSSSGAAAADTQYQKALKLLSSGGGKAEQRQAAKNLILDRLAFGKGSKEAAFIKGAKGKDAQAIQKAREAYQAQLSQAQTQQDKSKAAQNYKKQINLASIQSTLIENAKKDGKSQLGVNTRGKAEKIAQLYENQGAYVSQQKLDKHKITRQQYDKAIKQAYGTQATVQGLLKANLPILVQLFQQLMSQGIKVETKK